MKAQLDALKFKVVTVFCQTLSGAHCMVEGILIGGELPGQPYGVVNEYNGETKSKANISFQVDNIASIEVRSNQNIIILK